MISDEKRRLIQENNGKCILNKAGIFTVRYVCFVIAFLVLFIISALRDHVGYDYGLYANVYLNITGGKVVSSGWLGWGYIAICRLIGIFATSNYYIMFATMAFLTLWFLMRAIYKMSCSWAMSLYLFVSFCFYYQSFNQFRQTLAITIALYACYFLIYGNIKRYLLYIFFAASIHMSALVMITLCFIYKTKINTLKLLLYLMTCIFLQVFYDTFLVRLMYMSHYGHYMNSMFDEAMTFSSIMKAVSAIAILFGCLVFYKRTIKRAPYTVIFYNAATVSTIVSLLAVRSYTINRIIPYFHIMYIILIPEVLKSIDECFDRASAMLIRLFVVLSFFVYHSFYYYSVWAKAGYKMLFLS